VGFLHQHHLAGELCLAGFGGLAHGLAPHRLGKHVVAEGRYVAINKGFEIDDRRIEFARTGGLYLVGREALGAYLGEVLRQRLRPYRLGEADTLDAGVVLRELEAVDIAAPLGAAHLAPGVEQAQAAQQHLLVVGQALADGLADVCAEQFELRLDRTPLRIEHVPQDHRLDQQHDDQHHP